MPPCASGGIAFIGRVHTVEHEPDRQRFVIRNSVGDSELAYAVDGDRVDFNHTYVPPGLRGGTRAEELVKTGLAWAKSRELRVEASCSYVQKYLQRHPL